MNDALMRRVFDKQASMVVVSSGKEILDANQSFFRVFDGYKSLPAFKEDHRCICELFEVEEKYGFIYDFKDKSWIKYLQSGKNKRHKVKINIHGDSKIFTIDIDTLDENYILTFTDITDLEDYKQELEMTTGMLSQYKRIVESSSLVVNTDPTGRIINVNEEILNISGYSREELIGQNYVDMLYSNLPAAAIEAITRKVKNREVWKGRIVNRKKSGSFYIVDATISPIVNTDNEIIEYIGIQKDITEIIREKERARKAESAKGLFLANMSHEIRTPLNAILGYTKLLLKQGTIDEQTKEMLEIIDRSSEDLLYIVNDILDLTKFEHGVISLTNEPFSPHKLLQQIMTLFGAKAAEKGIMLEFNDGADLDKAAVSDEHRLMQVLSNLVSNAIKFTHRPGSVSLSLETLRREEDRIVLKFSVADTGIGMDEEVLKRIFKPFEQAELSTEKDFGGTGLGLTISTKIVEALGSRLEVESSPGEGSCFYFILECDLVERRQTDVENSVEHYVSSEGRVLLVDDHPVNRKLISTLLDEMVSSVETASDGLEAVEKFRHVHYDLVLMDIEMPVMGGEKALVKLRELEKERGKDSVPIVALTAHTEEALREKYLESGFDDVLTKPVSEVSLYRVLRQFLSKTDKRMTKSDSLDEMLSPEVVQEITALYFEVIEPDLANLKEAVEMQNREQITALGHKIKGSSLTIGYDEIAKYASKIEQSAKEQSESSSCCRESYILLENAIAAKRRSVLGQ